MRDSAARWYVAAGAACCIVAGLWLAPRSVARLMTGGYHALRPSDVPQGVTAVVVLGSGVNRAPRERDAALDTLNREGAARTLEAARLFRVLNPDWVITSGGKGDADRSQPSGMVMRDALIALGVPAARIVVEAASRTTHDEAVLVPAMLRRLGAEHLVLVTSPIHMTRSVGAFRAEGWQPIPAIAAGPPTAVPTTADILHELIGIPYYRARGWYR